MKLLIEDYIFYPDLGTIYFPNWPSHLTNFCISSFLLITNMEDNEVIFQFNDPELGGSIEFPVQPHRQVETTGVNYTLQLVKDTSAMSETDTLQIFVDVVPSMTLTDPEGSLRGGWDSPLNIQWYEMHGTFAYMLKELKKINMHLESITDEHVRNLDINGE